MFGSIYSYIKEFIRELKHPSEDVIREAVQEQKELCEKLEALHLHIISHSVEMQAFCEALQSFGVDVVHENVVKMTVPELVHVCKQREISLSLLMYKVENRVKTKI
jgi:hypothetical protein